MNTPILAAAALATILLASSAFALTSKEKMETCKFGAAEQQLTGKKEQDFIKKCMANEPAAKTTSKSAPKTSTPPPAQK